MIRRNFLILLTLYVSVCSALVGCANARADVSEMERREQALNQSIMCPVCPGESIDQSQVALAAQMRGIVRDKLAEGWTDEQVREFFVERYGPSVLLAPPTEGISLAVWLVPPIGVAAALGVFVFALRHMRRRHEEPDDDVVADYTTDEDLHRYYERIEASMPETTANENGRDR